MFWFLNKSKEISPGCSLEGLMLKLKLQYFGHHMWRVDSLEKTDAGRDWGQEEKGTTEDEMAGWYHWLDGREWVNSGSWWWTGRPGVLQFIGSQRVGHDWVTELNWIANDVEHGKKCSTFLITRAIQIETTVSYPFTPTRMLIMKETCSNKCCQWYKGTGTLQDY